MLAFVIVLQVLVALFLIMVVLLQPGNRGGASAALGGAGSDTVFGARGANTFLSKITFGAAIGFMVTNLMLSYMSSSSEKSVLDSLPQTAPIEQKPAGEQAPPGEPSQDPAAPSEAAPKEGALEKPEQGALADDQPAAPGEQRVPSGDQPAASSEQRVPSGDQPAASREQREPSSDQPASSNEPLPSADDAGEKRAD